MKASELRDLAVDELSQRIQGNEEELMRLRFQAATGNLESPVRVRVLRRENARIMTILRERKLGLR